MRRFLHRSSKAIVTALCLAMLTSGLSGCSIGGSDNDVSTSDSDDEDGDSIFSGIGKLTGDKDGGSDDATDGDAGDDSDDASDMENGGEAETDPETDGEDSSESGGSDKDNSDKGTDQSDASEIPQLYKRTATEYRNADDGTRLATEEYDSFCLYDDEKDKYPTLEKVLKIINAEAEIETDINETAAEAQLQVDQMEDTTYFGGYTDEAKLSIERLDSKVISVRENYYGYWGGAHGMYGDSGYTYDLTTGEKIGIYDVVKDEDTLLEVLTEKIQELYPDVWEYDLEGDNDAILTAIDDEENINWTMQTDGITIYFNPYAIAAYAAGEQTVPIRFDEYPDLFTGSYGNSEVEDWAKDGSELQADIDGDGDIEIISVWERYFYEEDYSYSYVDGFQISVDDQTYEFDGSSFDTEYTFVKKGSNYYLYIFTQQESDYNYIYMYDLTGGEPKALGEMQGSLATAPGAYAYEYDENSYSEYSGVITSLDQFYIYVRTNIAGTRSGRYEAKVGADGKIEASGDQLIYYNSGPDYPDLTAKKDMTYDTVDEDGNVTGTKDVKNGDTIIYYRTDDEGFADMKTNDGTIIRLNIDDSEWPYTIDGEDIQSLFDGIVFAS